MKVSGLLNNTKLSFKSEHSFTPNELVNELKPSEKLFFKILFTEKIYSKIYRLHEFESKE